MKKYIFLIALALLVIAPQILLGVVCVAVCLVLALVGFGLLYIAITESPFNNSNDTD